MFGVPGDFNLGFLVGCISNNTIYLITWVYRTWSKIILVSIGLEIGILFGTIFLHYCLNLDCTSNELNAAYAADGYARVKEGSLGAVTTTSVSRFFLYQMLTYLQVWCRRIVCYQWYSWW